MTATDELRRLLDERGVEWEDISDFGVAATNWWSNDGSPCTALESDKRPLLGVPDGKLSVEANLTPKQAVEATLGRGECRLEADDHHVKGVTSSWGCACSECGAFHRFTHGKEWRYCPNCGRKVVDA